MILARIIAAFVVGVFAASCPAAVITQINPDPSLASASWSLATVAGHTELNLSEDFKTAGMVDSPLILQVTLDASDIGKDLWLVYNGGGDQAVNQTGVAWNAFQVLVVNVPSVLPQYCNAGFTDLGGVSSDAFGAPVSDNAGQISFGNGIVASGGSAAFSNIHIAYRAQAGDVFYIKEIPSAPEPATIAMLALGGVFVARRKK